MEAEQSKNRLAVPSRPLAVAGPLIVMVPPFEARTLKLEWLCKCVKPTHDLPTSHRICTLERRNTWFAFRIRALRAQMPVAAWRFELDNDSVTKFALALPQLESPSERSLPPGPGSSPVPRRGIMGY